ncbi:type II toxin-antitoxin system death-on-curing family toxin [soil metagenome]
MKEPVWLSREVVLATQGELLDRFGGLEGIRDDTLLESALHQPQHLFNYGEPTLVELAASYATGIVKNLPFLGGNKRSGFMAAALFLESNGLDVHAPEEEVVERTLALAASAITEKDYAEWLKRSCS